MIPSLAAGGAERIMAALAGWWAARGEPVTLVTLDASTSDHFTLPPAVRRITLDLARRSPDVVRATANNVRRVTRLRAALRRERPDVVVSFMYTTNVLAILAALGTGIPVVVSERSDPTREPVPAPWERLRRALYRRAAAVVVQTASARAWAEGFTDPARVFVVPNPVAARAPRHARSRTVVGMGRLGREKGFDLLVRAFAAVAPRHPEWTLVVYGDGEERGALERLSAECGIADRVSLPGTTPDPDRALASAGLFVLPSRYEGFPNALLEAMALGTPSLAADCGQGVRDIVHDGVDGVLVPAEDTESLASALDRLLGDGDVRARLGARATEVVERFGVDRVMPVWHEIVRRAAEARR